MLKKILNYKTMNKPQNNGGAAFPYWNCAENTTQGMTLRDWFAGQALSGILSSSGCQLFREAEIPLIEIAEYADRLADAMLAARNERQEP